MSRPPFSLSDDQACDLVQRVTPLLDRYPVDPRDHRPFLRAFIRVVHDLTGKLYGPDIYRRLLRAYAPGRNPSTPTIASERDALERELVNAAGAPPSGPALALPPAAVALDSFQLRACRSLPALLRRLAVTPRSTTCKPGCATPSAPPTKPEPTPPASPASCRRKRHARIYWPVNWTSARQRWPRGTRLSDA